MADFPYLPGLAALDFSTFTDIGNWTPPDSASGPQNRNVIDYSKVLTDTLHCDPIKGCNPTDTSQPTPTPSPTPGDVGTSGTSWWSCIIQNPTNPALCGGKKAADVAPDITPGWLGGAWLGRAAAFIGGLIFIAGGIYMLKGPEITIGGKI